MISPGYIIKRIKTSNYKEMFAVAKRVSKKTGRSFLWVMRDMLGCIAKHETGYMHYEIYKMYEMTESERARFLTVGRNNRLVVAMNDQEDAKILDDKIRFNERYDKYLKRGWMTIDPGKLGNLDIFVKFCEDKESIIAKPVDASGGKGVTKIFLSEEHDLRKLYDNLYETGRILVEEVVVQVEEMNKLCSTAANTIRMVTMMRDDGEVGVVAGAVRFGREGRYVDNFHAQGLAMTLDVSTGKSVTDGYDINMNMYKTAPIIGTELKGFQIPMWDECKKLVLEAAHVIPTVRYVGWDVCISKKYGPCLIEGNPYPGQDVTQYHELNLGTYDAFMKFLNGGKKQA